MFNFCFYLGRDQRVLEKMRKASFFTWGQFIEESRGDFTLFLKKEEYLQSFVKTRIATGAVSGYVRREDLSVEDSKGDCPSNIHNRHFIEKILDEKGWPLGSEWTGAFCAASFSELADKIILCADPINYLPLYFSIISGKNVVGGTSLIVLGRSIEATADVVGICQRIHPYTPSCGGNFGRRTILKNVYRLLPGERVSISLKDFKYTSDFDNSLCCEVLDGEIGDVGEMVWELYKKEVRESVAGEEAVSVALSGGWDSRLVLGALKEGQRIECLSYGGEETYEVKMAARCAAISGATFQAFPMEGLYFPQKSELVKLIKQTEFAYILSWNAILSSVENKGAEKKILLLGDMTDGLTGKSMSSLSGRNYRTRMLMRSLVGQSPEMPRASQKTFDEWKKKMRQRIINEVLRFSGVLAPHLQKSDFRDEIIQETEMDLSLDFSRIQDNDPKFAPMYEELFTWFHYTRCGMASQVLLANYKFRAYCPAMSMRFMRFISSLHPRLRLGRKLIDSIANQPDFDFLASIPSAQVPWVSARTPVPVKEVIWGARALLDDLFMKKFLKTGNPNKKQQFLTWHNYVNEYRRAETLNRVEDWFSGKWLKEDRFIDLVKRRASLKLYPHINSDIAIPANVSILMDLCVN